MQWHLPAHPTFVGSSHQDAWTYVHPELWAREVRPLIYSTYMFWHLLIWSTSQEEDNIFPDLWDTHRAVASYQPGIFFEFPHMEESSIKTDLCYTSILISSEKDRKGYLAMWWTYEMAYGEKPSCVKWTCGVLGFYTTSSCIRAASTCTVRWGLLISQPQQAPSTDISLPELPQCSSRVIFIDQNAPLGLYLKLSKVEQIVVFYLGQLNSPYFFIKK